MAKTKSYDVDLVIEGIDKYYYIENHGNYKELIMTKICKYLNAHGFPNINDRKLNRDKIVREHIENLKVSASTNMGEAVISYTPLNVEDFIKTNNSIVKLKKALTILDNCHEKMHQLVQQKVKELECASESIKKYTDKIHELTETSENDKAKIKELKQKNSESEAEQKRYKGYIKDTMLPEIANEILRHDRKIFNGPEMVSKSGYDNMVADDDGLIDETFKDIGKQEKRFKNNIISGLFDSLKKDN